MIDVPITINQKVKHRTTIDVDAHSALSNNNVPKNFATRKKRLTRTRATDKFNILIFIPKKNGAAST